MTHCSLLTAHAKTTIMKFINYLEKITGVDVYALSSFSIFFVFFMLMLLWVWKADKKMIDEISRIPLEN
jgi:hypothetical protein